MQPAPFHFIALCTMPQSQGGIQTKKALAPIVTGGYDKGQGIMKLYVAKVII